MPKIKCHPLEAHNSDDPCLCKIIDLMYLDRESTDHTGKMQSINMNKMLHACEEITIRHYLNERLGTQLPMELPKRCPIHQPEPAEIAVKGTWYTVSEKSRPAANVFGKDGVLDLDISDDSLRIPSVNALNVTDSFLKKYNATLIGPDTPFFIDAGENQPAFLITYSFTSNYLEDFMMQADKGGGVFVEKHNFEHVWIPESPSCSGRILLAHQEHDTYYFTALEVPFGFGLKIERFQIHGDIVVGNWSVSLSDKPATSVLLRRTGDDITPLKVDFVTSDD